MLDPGSVSVIGRLQGCKEKRVEMGNQCCCSVMSTKELLSVFTDKHIMYSVLLDSTEVKVGSKNLGKLN